MMPSFQHKQGRLTSCKSLAGRTDICFSAANLSAVFGFDLPRGVGGILAEGCGRDTGVGGGGGGRGLGA